MSTAALEHREPLKRLERWLAGRPCDDANLAAFVAALWQTGYSHATASLSLAAATWRARRDGIADPVGGLSSAKLAEFANDPLQDQGIAEATRRAYWLALSRVDKWLAGRPCDDENLAGFVRHLMREGRHHQTAALALASVKWRARRLDLVNPVGRMASEKLNAFKRDPAPRGRGPSATLTQEDVDALLEFASDRDFVMTKALMHGALRRSELAALTWGDISPHPSIEDAHQLIIRRSKTDQHGKSRLALVRGISRQLEAIRPADMTPEQAAATPLIAGWGGKAVTGWTINERFKRLCRRAGLSGFTSHSCRAAHAATGMQRGASLPQLMQSGGWRSPQMVAHYAAEADLAGGTVAQFFK